jgi:hypothetical protein
MVIRFFASNPKIFYKQDGRPKSEDRCTGHFSFLVRFILSYHFTGIIAYIHFVKYNFSENWINSLWIFNYSFNSNKFVKEQKKPI